MAGLVGADPRVRAALQRRSDTRRADTQRRARAPCPYDTAQRSGTVPVPPHDKTGKFRMNKIKALKCKECGQESAAVAKHVCEFCFGPLEVVYNYDLIRAELTKEKIQSRPHTLWRYWELLPVETREVLSLNEGFTPFWKSRNLGAALGLKNLYIKNDSVNPTFSFKDRVVSVALTRSKELGFDTVACASTGNLAGAVAAYGSVGKFRTFVFIPADLEMGKIIGAGVYDPIIVGIEGNYDEVKIGRAHV